MKRPVRPVVLASTSRYRRELLGRILADFATDAPEVDETPLPHETPEETARRLSEAKARAVAPRHPGALIIGSDQVAALGNLRLTKPGNLENARRQLAAMAGQSVTFHTGLCLLDSGNDRARTLVVPYAVHFRPFSDAERDAYLAREQPYDCSGGIRSEGLGVALMDRMEGPDPTALVGLPLIALCGLLAAAGVAVL